MSDLAIALWLAAVTLLGSTLLSAESFGRGSVFRSLLLLVALAAGILYAGSWLGVGERLALAGGGEPVAEIAPPPTLTTADMPPAQRALILAVQRARDAYASGTNDMARGAARPVRGKEVCAAVTDGAATGWAGLVTGLSSRPDGRGVLSIDLGERTSATTRTNADTDRTDKTLIEPGSPVFQQASRLRVGQKVRFSGRFATSETDCLKEGSLTLAASMQRPEYLMTFSSIEPFE